MNPVRIAVIGCGRIASKHVSSMMELGPVVQLTALCDIHETRLKAFNEQVCLMISAKNSSEPITPVQLYTDVNEMLLRDDIDLVIVASSSHTHASFVLASLRAGKHVLVEKPLALSLKEARLATEEAERRGLILAVSLQVRYHNYIQKIKNAVEAGDFGQLIHGKVSMRWNRDMAYYDASPWRNSWTAGGGLFMNQCIHYIDLLLLLMGPLESVYAEGHRAVQPLQVENIGAAILKFKNGAIGIIEASAAVFPHSLETSISLFGERGSVVLEGERLNELKHWAFQEERSTTAEVQEGAGEISHTPLYQDVIEAIRTKGVPLTSGKAALASLESVLAIYKSISTGTKVMLPLDDFDMNRMSLHEQAAAKEGTEGQA